MYVEDEVVFVLPPLPPPPPREPLDRPGRGAPCVELEPHLRPLRRRLEGNDLDRDQLRLAFLVVDPPLDDEDAVGLEQVARGAVDRVEDDRLDRAGNVV